MLMRTQGIAFITGLLVLTGMGVFPAAAMQQEEAEGTTVDVDPVSNKLQIKLSAKFRKRGLSKQDRGAMAAFYAERKYKPVWILDDDFNDKAGNLMKELAKARTYGLNPADYAVPALSTDEDEDEYATDGELADAELALTKAALTYIRHANGHRFDQTDLSRFLDRKAAPINIQAKLNKLANVVNPAYILRRQHPSHPQFKALMAALAKTKSDTVDMAERIRIPRGRVLKLGMKHRQIGLVRRRLGVTALQDGQNANIYDAELQTAVMAFQKKAGLKAEGIIGLKTRFALNAPKQNRRKQILANMERWRWMPRSFGKTHIRVNIPEYLVRVTQNDQIIHQERVIVGKPINKTPVFSDVMESVVFNPYWNVPQSIIWTEMNGRVPSRGYEGGVRNGRMWIRQLPGPRNALGRVKFLFPNKHAVYMHDTPTKRLFNKKRRAYSHGCMRVRDPKRLAEVILGMNGWSKARTSRKWSSSSNQQVPLKTKIPVHVTYFTLWADKDGVLQSFNDIYGHDNRIYAAATRGVAYAKAKFPEVRKKKIEPRISRYNEYERSRRYNDWWASSNSSSYWGGSYYTNRRQRPIKRKRIYRKKRKQANFENIFPIF